MSLQKALLFAALVIPVLGQVTVSKAYQVESKAFTHALMEPMNPETLAAAHGIIEAFHRKQGLSIKKQSPHTALKTSKQTISRQEKIKGILYNLIDSMPMDLIKIIAAYDGSEFKGKLQCSGLYNASPSHIEHLGLESINCLEILENSNIVVSGDSDGTICMWDTSTGKCLQQIENAHELGHINSLVALPDKEFVSGSHEGPIKRWSLDAEKKWFCSNIFGYQKSLNRLFVLKRLPNNRLAVLVSKFSILEDLLSKMIITIDLKSWKQVQKIAFKGVTSKDACVLSSNNDDLVLGGEFGIIALDPYTLEHKRSMECFPTRKKSNCIKSVALSPNNNLISVEDGCIKEWAILTGQSIQKRTINKKIIKVATFECPEEVAALQDGKIAVRFSNGKVLIFNSIAESEVPTVLHTNSCISALKVLPDGRLVIGTIEGGIQVFE